MRGRLTASAKSFLCDGSPFHFRGARGGELFARHAGFTVAVGPPGTRFDRIGLPALVELTPTDVAGAPRARARARTAVAAAVERALGACRAHQVLGVVVPGPAGDAVAGAVRDLLPHAVVGWSAHPPLHTPPPPEFDFLLLDVSMTDPGSLGEVLMACHSHVGDRPLVAAGIPWPAGDLRRAEELLDTALASGVAGTVFDVGPGEDPDALARLNARTVRDLDATWPSMSVVVNAYNAEATLPECLHHLGRLDYPALEIVVVDDGSSDRTVEIAQAHPRVRCLAIARSGLSEARNVGYRAATGEIVAYLDADAYPVPDWPWYLALAAGADGVGAFGGPNVPPPDDPPAARAVARSPGGPVPQLATPGRARHLPGCNMAFRRAVLDAIGGFDPVLEATEDVEIQDRLLASGFALGYHPAAVVWHHRRAGIRPYLRQQRHYGRGQAIYERRHPERFPAGYRIRHAASRVLGRPPARARDTDSAVNYRSLAPPMSNRAALVHQWGVPLAAVLAITAPLGLRRRRLGAPAAAGLSLLGVLFALDAGQAGRGATCGDRTPRTRLTVATLRLMRPLAFRWGHLHGWLELARRDPAWPPPPARRGPPTG